MTNQKLIKLVRVTTVPLSLQKLISGQMRFMKNNGFQVTMISSDFKGKSKLEEIEESQFIAVNMTRAITPFADFRALIRLIREFNRLKPEIVHTHTPKAGLLGMMAAKITGVPIRLHTVAGLPLMEETGAKRKLLNLIEKLTYACASSVYPNSSNLKNFIIASGFAKSKKLKVIGNGSSNGIDTVSFRKTADIEFEADKFRSDHNLSIDDFIFIFVGRLVKDKGIEELVGAFRNLSAKHPKLKLLLVGPSEPDLDPLSGQCLEDIKSNKAVLSVGFQSDVRPFLAVSNALVFPSYREGFPNVPMQAGCYDLPSIVTNINGCNEIIEEGKNGLIIPVKDQKALESAMEKLYTDVTAYKKMASNSREMIVNRYEQKKVWSLILDEYQNHLKSKKIVR